MPKGHFHKIGEEERIQQLHALYLLEQLSMRNGKTPSWPWQWHQVADFPWLLSFLWLLALRILHLALSSGAANSFWWPNLLSTKRGLNWLGRELIWGGKTLRHKRVIQALPSPSTAFFSAAVTSGCRFCSLTPHFLALLSHFPFGGNAK